MKPAVIIDCGLCGARGGVVERGRFHGAFVACSNPSCGQRTIGKATVTIAIYEWNIANKPENTKEM